MYIKLMQLQAGNKSSTASLSHGKGQGIDRSFFVKFVLVIDHLLHPKRDKQPSIICRSNLIMAFYIYSAKINYFDLIFCGPNFILVMV